MTGPGFWESWLRWRAASPENRRRAAVRAELDRSLHADPVTPPPPAHGVTEAAQSGPRWIGMVWLWLRCFIGEERSMTKQHISSKSHGHNFRFHFEVVTSCILP